MKKPCKFSTLFLSTVLVAGFAFCQIAEANLAARDSANYGPSYAALDEGQKAFYQALESACAEGRALAVYPGASMIWDLRNRDVRLNTAYAAYQADHPEEMRVETLLTTGLPGLFTIILPAYDDDMTEAREEQALEAAEALCASLEGLSPREQVTELYRYLTSTVTYENTESVHHTMYAALLDHTACCQGVASAMGWCLNRLGIESRILAGEIDKGGHAWNAVKLDGVWYELDATWDLGDPQEEWRWFLVDQAHTLLSGAGLDCPTQREKEAA